MGDETGGSSSKLDSLGKDELVKLVKKYIVLHKQLKTKNEELTNKLNASETSQQTSTNNEVLVEQLNEQIETLKNENNVLNDKINHQNSELVELRAHLDELERFKLDMEPQLETARREIELNKSMLDMLNNEINHLNGEKLQLEKKLISARRNTTPSVIVEEEEEDLEEEEREANKMQRHHLGSVAAASSTGNNLSPSGIDVATTSPTNNVTPHGSLLFLNKDIEELTFYVDELKSELEAERERNNEYSNEIRGLKKELDDLKSIPTRESDDDNSSQKPLQSDMQTSSKMFDKLKELFENGAWDKEDYFDDDMFKQVFNVLKQKFKAYEKSLSDAKTKQTYMETQMEKIISDFKREVTDLEAKLAEKVTELNTLKSQNEANSKTIKSDLDSEREKAKNLQSKLEKFEKEAAKSKRLDLEIADYERSIKSLNIQLIAKEKEITDLRAENGQLTSTAEKSKVDIDKLESELSDEREKSAKLKQLLVVAKKDLADAKSHQAEKETMDASIRHQIERLQGDLDAYKLQMADSVAEKERLRERIAALTEAAQRSHDKAEQLLAEKQDEVDEANKRIKSLETDYEAYKLKVQHAFKKQKEESSQQHQHQTNQANTNALLAEREAELERLNVSLKHATAQLEASNERVHSLERANESLQDEYTHCLERNNKLIADLKQKETQWEARLSELNTQGLLKQEEHDKAIKALEKLGEQRQTELKERIKTLQSQHCQAIDFLQKQLLDARSEIERLAKLVDELKSATNQTESSSSPRNLHSPVNSTSNMNNNYRVNLLIKVDNNETAENQDTTATTKREETMSPQSNGIISAKSIKTFEQLLNETSMSPASANLNNTALFSPAAPNGDVDKLKVDLAKSKVQLEHVNELLNESELNNARLSEQINLLKEEIRRLERNQEREKSISNMEYLKNVVMKFLTLSSAQERTQLIPVLSTMLRLSQEEQNAIVNYSKALPTQSQSSSHSWGAYLPKWS